jgi:hypothetical protein
MIDELDRLRTNVHLHQLLQHYAQLGAADRTIWQDRVMHMEGVGPRDLGRLHGELIAFGWIEQNTGVTSVLQPGVVAGCYRITSQGLRALKVTKLEQLWA